MVTADHQKGVLDNVTVRFVTSFGFRLINAFSTSTFFQADEYYQSWEVAYEDLHGIGFRSWEWQAGIRTSLIPLLFQGVIKSAEFLNINHLTLGRILMAALASVADVYTSLVAEQLAGRDLRLKPSKRSLGRTAWYISLFSMFNWYCSIRPFSNTIEMVLVVVALFYWYSNSPWKVAFAQTLAHLAIALRPSVAIFWIPLALDMLVRTRTWTKRIMMLLLSIAVTAVVQVGIVASDVFYYGENIIPYYEFVKYNFFAKISELYGVHPWHWYISQGLPFLLLGYLPFVHYGWSSTPWKVKALVYINVLLFSCIPHKEFRFLYYLLPILHFIAALGFDRTPKKLKIAGFVVNIIAGIYFSMFHQRGVMDVVTTISGDPEIRDISFIMPCHSTPWHAHFQRPQDPDFKPQFLTCEPPWNVSSLGYVDEADQFYNAPIKFLKTHSEKLDSHIVIFQPLEALLTEMGYKVTHRFYNGLFNEDRRRKGEVLIMKKKNL